MTEALHPRVLELIASRICHDMVSPVGAISNGVELVQEMGAAAGEEAMQLIASSAEQAGIRLKVFRLCYGAGGTDKNVGFKDIRDIFVDLIGEGRVSAEFESDLGVKFSMPPRGFFKVLLNLLILAEECNRGEGKISVTALDGNKGVKVAVVGTNAGLREGALDALEGKTAPDDLDARSVHAYVTGKFAKHFNFTLSQKQDAARIDFELTF